MGGGGTDGGNGYGGSYGGVPQNNGYGGSYGTSSGSNYGSGAESQARAQRAWDEAQAVVNRTRTAPPATPVSATPNYVTGPTAYNNETGSGQSNNPFNPNAQYALQLHWLENQLGRGQAQIGAHGELLNAQGRNLNAQYGFSNREGDLRLKAGEADRAYIDKSRLNIDQLRALYGEQAANEIAGLNQKADVNRRDINSKATAAGAYFFAGRGDHINDVNNDLANSTENVNLSTRQKLLNLDDRGNELENRSAKLDLLGSEVGLDRDKARAALEFGMAQLGYSKFLDSNQLLDMLDNKNSSQYDLLVNLVNQAFKVGVDWNTGAIGSDYQKFTGGQ